jgi:hypothetical protein
MGISEEHKGWFDVRKGQERTEERISYFEIANQGFGEMAGKSVPRRRIAK